jgi:hypothetical protein
MAQPKFDIVDELPYFKPDRDHNAQAQAAVDNYPKWIRLPWKDDQSGGLVHLYKKHHNCIAKTIDRQVYIQAIPEK